MLTAIKSRSLLSWFSAHKAKPFRLHEEWRLLLFVCLYGTMSAFAFSTPSATGVLASLIIFTLVTTVVIKGFRSWASIAILALLSAVLIASTRSSYFERIDFPSEQFVQIDGRVDQLDFRPGKSTRLIVSPFTIEGFRGEKPPRRIRLAVRTGIGKDVAVGTVVTLRAIISPVGGAIVPGGFDFGRSALLKNIQADGYAASRIEAVPHVVDKPKGFISMVDTFRYKMARHIQDALPGQSGALAVALTIGLRHGIDDKTSETLRKAGLSHLLAISGLHMGIVAASAFFAFELLFASIPALALRIMPRKLAVAPAWTTALMYLLLSGGSTATIRAFLMVSVAMLAVLTGRRVLSLRSVALAALCILVIWPESILTIGFQMSFAATTGLVVFYERFSKSTTWRHRLKASSFGGRALIAFSMIGVTSIIAQASIAPFALYHFQAVSLIAVLSNMLVLPLVSFLVMPLLMVALVLAVFSGVPLISWLLAPILSLILAVADVTANMEFAVVRSEPFTLEAIALLCAAQAMLLMVQSSKHVAPLSGVLFLAGLLWPSYETADVLLSNTGSSVAEKRQGQLFVSGTRSHSFRLKSWKRYWAFDGLAATRRLEVVGNASARRTQLQSGHQITKVQTLSATRHACAYSSIVIIPDKYERYCRGPQLIIKKSELNSYGPAGLFWGQDNKIKLVWSNPPKS